MAFLCFLCTQALHFAATCVVTWSGGSTYSVTCSEGGHELVVNLEIPQVLEKEQN